MSIKTETSVLELVINGKQAETSMNGLTNSIRAAEREFRKMRAADDPKKYAEAAKNIHLQKEAYNGMRQSINGVGKESESAWKQIAKGVITGQSIIGVFQYAASAVKNFISTAIGTYAEFEKMGAVLTNALGSKSEAKKALYDLQKFASETPFQLQELTGSYLKLVNRGLRPTMDQMRLMGDLTASQGKGFDQYTEALLDASTGQFERLKEIGITASKNGDKVSLSFKGITKEVQYTGLAIQGALEDFAKLPGVAGSMESMSQTLSQAFSNFGDNVDKLAVRFGGATGGFIFEITSAFSALIGKMGDARSEVEKLTDELIQTDRGIKQLDSAIKPLTKRYEELTSKTSLNKDEQKELQTVMNSIADIMPNAVTQWDKYGNAIGISTEKIKAGIEEMKLFRQIQYADTIKATEEEIKNLTKLQEETKFKLNRGEKFAGGIPAPGQDAQMLKLTDDEKRAMSRSLKSYTADLTKLNDKLNILNGHNLDLLNTTDEKIKKEQQAAALAQDAAAKAKLDAAQAKKDGEDAQKRLEQTIKVAKKLIDDTLIAGLNPLDEIVAKIAAQFDPLIIKLQAAGQTDLVKKLQELKKLSTDTSITKYNAEDAKKKADQAAKDKQEEYKAAQTLSDSFYQIEKVKVGQQYVDGLIDKKTYEDKLAILEKERIESLIAINLQYGVSVLDLENQLVDAKIAARDRDTADAEKRKEEAIKRAKDKKDFEIETAQIASDTIFSILSSSSKANSDAKISQLEKERTAELNYKELSEKQKKAINDKYDAQVRQEKQRAWVAEQRAAAAQAIINGALAITKVLAQTGTFAGFVIPTIIAGTAAQLAIIAAQKAPKFGSGGFMPEGPNHANGGMTVLGANGQPVANIEGGEPILSRETYRNNRETIDALLYSSQRMNGARMQFNDKAAIRAEQYFRSGGIIGGSSVTNNNTNNNTNFDMAQTNALLIELASKFNDFSKKPWVFPMKTFYEKDIIFKNTINDATA